MREQEKDIEEKVLQRYMELAGLVRDGQMVNKDKEERAREYVKIQEKIAIQVKEEREFSENGNYGKFIIQSNEVHFHLVQFILLRSFNPDAKFQKHLTESTFGTIISYLNVCSQSEADVNLINDLRIYKSQRDVLAHGMFTPKKLTLKECESAVTLGERIINYLFKHMKEDLELKGTEKMSEFPTKFNRLKNHVDSLEVRVKKLEGGNDKEKGKRK